MSSRFQIFASSLLLKTCITNFINLDVSRVTGFPEFPNTSPSGKRVDSNDPIPRTFHFSKKRHPRNVEGDTRHPETSQRSNRGAFAELPPRTYNKRLPLSKFFHRSLALLRTVVLSFAENRLAICVCGFKFSPNFSKVLLYLSLNSCFFFPSYWCSLFCEFYSLMSSLFLLFVLLSNRWLESKVLQDP
jgi:hypothetical protein